MRDSSRVSLPASRIGDLAYRVGSHTGSTRRLGVTQTQLDVVARGMYGRVGPAWEVTLRCAEATTAPADIVFDDT